MADPDQRQLGRPGRAPNHIVLARDLQAYPWWRKANARHPDVLTAQHRERVRSEHHLR